MVPIHPVLVVVNGHVASGKTTLARPLARALGLPLLARDDVKETLYDTLGIGDVAWSRKLGRASYALLFAWAAELLGAGRGLVVEANFSRDAEQELRKLPPHRLVQVYCTAPRELLVERFRTRERHPGHPDAEVGDEAVARIDDPRWAPLELGGEPIVVDTAQPVDVAAVAARVRAAGMSAA